ncbi:MAG: STAS domain-containing protein [Actinomycetota bacterium]
MLSINTKRDSILDIHIVALTGEFDFLEKTKVESCLAKTLQEKPRGLVVDLSSVNLIDSSGIGLLMSYHAKFGKAGICMALVVNQNNYLIKKLNILGVFENVGLKAFDTLEEAISEVTAQ